VRDVESRAVFSNDEFRCIYGLDPELFLRENHGNRGTLRGVYCLVRLTTGGHLFEYYPAEKLEEIRSRSASYRYWKRTGKGGEIWGDAHNRLEMDRKAVWRNVSKWIPRSGSRYARALEIDERQYTDYYDVDRDAEERLYKVVGVGEKDSPADQLAAEFESAGFSSFEEALPVMYLMITDGAPADYESLDNFMEDDIESAIKLIGRAKDTLIGKKHTKEEGKERVYFFLQFCVQNSYLINTTRNLDDARSAFIKWEKENEATP